MNRVLAVVVAGLIAFGLIACSSDDTDDAPSSSPAASTDANKPVSLDTAFGTAGIASVPMNANTHDRFMAVAQGSDGKTYAAGFIIVGEGDQAMAVARIDGTGKLDTTFGTGGIASVNVGPGRTGEIARAVGVQTDGKIVIAGPFERDITAAGDAARDTDVAAVRFDTTGKPDATFGTNGVAKVDFGTGRVTTGTTFVGDTSWGMGIMSGNKVVLFGTKLADGADRVDTDFVIAGLTSAGVLDTAFGTAGKVVVDVSKVSDNPRHLLVQADGKIVSAGYSTIDGVVQPVLIRVDATGKPDTAFGTNGVATAKVLGGVAEAYSVSQQGNNYVMSGYGRGADATEKVDMIVYRFTGAGQWDSSFGTAGVMRLDIAKEDDRARNAIVLPDGRILAVGSGKKDAANIDAMMVLLNKDGAPIAGFGEAGHLISDLGGPADAWYGVTLSTDKKYVLVSGFKGTDANSAGNDDSVIAKVNL